MEFQSRHFDLAVERIVGLRVNEEVGAHAEVEATNERMLFRARRVEHAGVVLAEVSASREPDRRVVVTLHLSIFELRLERIVRVFELESNRDVVARGTRGR